MNTEDNSILSDLVLKTFSISLLHSITFGSISFRQSKQVLNILFEEYFLNSEFPGLRLCVLRNVIEKEKPANQSEPAKTLSQSPLEGKHDRILPENFNRAHEYLEIKY